MLYTHKVIKPTIPKLEQLARLVWKYRYDTREFKTDLGTVAHINKEVSQEQLFKWLDDNVEKLEIKI
ncbi:MAG: hypothetical protein ABI855_18905 [Bacteroidota bacterium]